MNIMAEYSQRQEQVGVTRTIIIKLLLKHFVSVEPNASILGRSVLYNCLSRNTCASIDVNYRIVPMKPPLYYNCQHPIFVH